MASPTAGNLLLFGALLAVRHLGGDLGQRHYGVVAGLTGLDAVAVRRVDDFVPVQSIP